MVRDLVVAREGRVDRGPPLHHVREDAVDDQVADDDAHRRAQERIDAAPVAARADVAPALARGGDPLEDHLPPEEDERPRDVEAVGEEGAVAGVGAPLGLHPADGQDHVVGVAREEVAAARAAVREQPRPPRVPPLDLGAVLRRRADHEHLPSPSRPSGRRGCRRSSRAGSPPGEAPVCDERSVSHSARRCAAVLEPARPSSARARRASPAAAPAARARRSRGRRSPARRSPDARPSAGRSAAPRAASRRRRRSSRRAPRARRRRPTRQGRRRARPRRSRS